jgi:hypothetical protein
MSSKHKLLRKTKLTAEQQTALGKRNFGPAPKQMSVLNVAIAVKGIAQRSQPLDDEEYKCRSPPSPRDDKRPPVELRAMS